jgi:hypothetical protein
LVSPLPSARKLRVAVRRTRDKQPAQLRRRLARAHVAFWRSMPSNGCAFSNKGIRMPIIRANAGIITQINVFTVAEGGQQALIDLLSESARFAKETPGWLSASLHKSRDGTRVVNYAQSESVEAAQAVIGRLRSAGFLDRNKALGEAHPGLYDVVFTLER